MTDQQHPITPPTELRDQWRREASRSYDGGVCREEWFIDRAAQWGADQELEACCEWQKGHLHSGTQLNKQLRAARRPKPPSLKDQALAALEQVEADFNTGSFGDTIRCALEALPND
jgi:hypothetical protein